jgi:hypothetical protein
MQAPSEIDLEGSLVGSREARLRKAGIVARRLGVFFQTMLSSAHIWADSSVFAAVLPAEDSRDGNRPRRGDLSGVVVRG